MCRAFALHAADPGVPYSALSPPEMPECRTRSNLLHTTIWNKKRNKTNSYQLFTKDALPPIGGNLNKAMKAPSHCFFKSSGMIYLAY